ncbi:bacteriocin-related protein (plasmid) [Lactiplantibacillus plantarum]|nr:bacteriocin-related protein [Lactiplantibacillus plantarum]
MSRFSKVSIGVIYVICTIVPAIIMIFERGLFWIGLVALGYFCYIGWFIFIKSHDNL